MQPAVLYNVYPNTVNEQTNTVTTALYHPMSLLLIGCFPRIMACDHNVYSLTWWFFKELFTLMAREILITEFQEMCMTMHHNGTKIICL